MQFAYERRTLVIEPSSAVALVPLLRPEPQLVGKRVDVVLTGGNVAWLRPGHVWTVPSLGSKRAVSGPRV
jgi:threonine dehydratase